MGDVVKMEPKKTPSMEAAVLMAQLFDGTPVGKALDIAEYARCLPIIEGALDKQAMETKNEIVAWMKNSPELTNIIQDDFREKALAIGKRALRWIGGLKRRERWTWGWKKAKRDLPAEFMAIVMQGTEAPVVPVNKAAELVPGGVIMDAAPVTPEVHPAFVEEKQ